MNNKSLDKISRLQDISNDLAHMYENQEEVKVIEEQLNQILVKTSHELSAWDRVQIARHPDRPTSLDYIARLFTDFTELHGDRLFGDDAAIVGGIAMLGDLPVTVIAQQRGCTTDENIKRNFGMPHPEGYRKSLRLMKQAAKFNRPIICFVDTQGAFPGLGAEERGQAEAIAQNLLQMFNLEVPIISVIIGQGGSGGALALAVSDRIYMLENAIYSILSPEGFASILWKDATKAADAAERMKITAKELKELSLIDRVIYEPAGSAEKNIDFIVSKLRANILRDLQGLYRKKVATLLRERYEKFRVMGMFTHFKSDYDLVDVTQVE